jgi:hypothetical protein
LRILDDYDLKTQRVGEAVREVVVVSVVCQTAVADAGTGETTPHERQSGGLALFVTEQQEPAFQQVEEGGAVGLESCCQPTSRPEEVRNPRRRT